MLICRGHGVCPFISKAAVRAPLMALMLTSLASSTSATEDGASWLDWNAPPECQNTAEVERRLESLLDHPVDRALLPRARAKLQWLEGKWQLDVTVQVEGSRRRQVTVSHCADAFDVIALALALVLEPKNDLGMTHSAEAEATAEVSAEATNEQPMSNVTVSLEPPRPSAEATIMDRPSAIEATTLASFSLRGAALSDLMAFPEPQLGGAVSAVLTSGPLALELEAGALRSSPVRFPAAAEDVRFWTGFGTLAGCVTTSFGAVVSWSACAGAQAGLVVASELGGAGRQPSATWLAAELGTGPTLSLEPWLQPYLRLNGLALLTRHEFALAGGRAVHRLPRATLQLELGLSFALTDF